MSHLREISTTCWLRKCSSSSFLPRTPSAFQQARRRTLPRTVFLGVLPYSATKRMTVFKTARWRAVPVGREEMDVSCRRVSSTHAWRGRRSRRSEIFSSGSCGFSGRGFDTRGYIPFDFPAAGWAAAVGLGSGFLGPACFLLAVTLCCLGTSVTGWGGGFGLGGGVVAIALATRPPSSNVAPSLT